MPPTIPQGAFAREAERWKAAGFFPVPVVPKTKRPAFQGWNAYIEQDLPDDVFKEWLARAGECSLGLALGTHHGDFRLVGIDIDMYGSDDDVSAEDDDSDLIRHVLRAVGPFPCAKKGRKGLTVFALAPPDLKSKKIQKRDLDGRPAKNQEGRVAQVEILAAGTHTVMPPSPHPAGDKYNYRWLTPRTLFDVPRNALAFINHATLDEIEAVLSGHGDYFLEINDMVWAGVGGGGTTHESCLRAVGLMVRRGWKDPDIHARIMRAKREACERSGDVFDWPAARPTIQEWIDSARRKGMDKGAVAPGDPKIAVERAAAEMWIAKHGGLERVASVGPHLRWCGDDEGFWRRLSEGKVQRELAADNPTMAARRIKLVFDTVHVLAHRPEGEVEPDTWRVCLEDGTYNLDTGELERHSHDHLLPWRMKARWDGDQKCDRYQETLSRIFEGDEERIEAFERFMGYCFVQSSALQLSLWLWGEGRTGKSTLTSLIYAMFDPPGTISALPMSSLGDAKARAGLVGRAVNISTEQSRLHPVADAAFKAIVSGDPVDVWFLYRGTHSLRLPTKFVIAANDLPPTSDVSSAFARRLLILPCGNPISTEQVDTGYLKRLLAERDGIARRWLGAARRARIEGRIPIPAATGSAVDEYMRSQDTVRQWREDDLLCEEEAVKEGVEEWSGSSSTVLYFGYRAWCESNGYRALPSHEWGGRLKKMGFPVFGKRMGKQVVKWRSLQPRPGKETRF